MAFQLANSIRDVDEGPLRGRIYLPLDELAARRGVTPDLPASAGRHPRSSQRRAEQVERVRRLEQVMGPGIAMPHPPCGRASMRARIVDERGSSRDVEANDYEASTDATVPMGRRLAVALPAWRTARVGGDASSSRVRLMPSGQVCLGASGRQHALHPGRRWVATCVCWRPRPHHTYPTKVSSTRANPEHQVPDGAKASRPGRRTAAVSSAGPDSPMIAAPLVNGTMPKSESNAVGQQLEEHDDRVDNQNTRRPNSRVRATRQVGAR